MVAERRNRQSQNTTDEKEKETMENTASAVVTQEEAQKLVVPTAALFTIRLENYDKRAWKNLRKLSNNLQFWMALQGKVSYPRLKETFDRYTLIGVSNRNKDLKFWFAKDMQPEEVIKALANVGKKGLMKFKYRGQEFVFGQMEAQTDDEEDYDDEDDDE